MKAWLTDEGYSTSKFESALVFAADAERVRFDPPPTLCELNRVERRLEEDRS